MSRIKRGAFITEYVGVAMRMETLDDAFRRGCACFGGATKRILAGFIARRKWGDKGGAKD